MNVIFQVIELFQSDTPLTEKDIEMAQRSKNIHIQSPRCYTSVSPTHATPVVVIAEKIITLSTDKKISLRELSLSNEKFSSKMSVKNLITEAMSASSKSILFLYKELDNIKTQKDLSITKNQTYNICERILSETEAKLFLRRIELLISSNKVTILNKLDKKSKIRTITIY